MKPWLQLGAKYGEISEFSRTFQKFPGNTSFLSSSGEPGNGADVLRDDADDYGRFGSHARMKFMRFR